MHHGGLGDSKELGKLEAGKQSPLLMSKFSLQPPLEIVIPFYPKSLQ